MDKKRVRRPSWSLSGLTGWEQLRRKVLSVAWCADELGDGLRKGSREIASEDADTCLHPALCSSIKISLCVWMLKGKAAIL